MNHKTLNIIENDKFLEEGYIDLEKLLCLNNLDKIVYEYIKNKDLFNCIQSVYKLYDDDIKKMTKLSYIELLQSNSKVSLEDLNKIIDINDNDCFTTKKYEKLGDENETITYEQLFYYLSNKIKSRLISFKDKLHELLAWYYINNIDLKLTESTIREFVDSYKNSIQDTLTKFKQYLQQKTFDIISKALNSYRCLKTILKYNSLSDNCKPEEIYKVLQKDECIL